MSPDTPTAAPARVITVDDLRHKAEGIRDMAKQQARAVIATDGAKMAFAGIVLVVAVVGLAYYLGTRRGL